jgi:hypothetical protein
MIGDQRRPGDQLGETNRRSRRQGRRARRLVVPGGPESSEVARQIHGLRLPTECRRVAASRVGDIDAWETRDVSVVPDG